MDRLFALLFPTKCLGCNTRGAALCTRCLVTIPFAAETDAHTYAVFDYANPLVQHAIKRLKYNRRSEALRDLTAAAVAHISEYLSGVFQHGTPQSIVLVPIPEHRSKHQAKGFNQSELIAKWLAKEIPGSTVNYMLQKIMPTAPQAHLKRNARLKNVMHSMKVAVDLDPKVSYIVIDDVTTTGATFAEARRALKEAGARKIICIALAHGYARK